MSQLSSPTTPTAPTVPTTYKSMQEVIDNVFHKPDYQNLVDSLCNKLKVDAKHLLVDGVTVTNLVTLTDLAMKEVGKLKNLVGYEKKALVVTTIRKLAKDTLKDLHGETDEVVAKLEEQIKNLGEVMDIALDSLIDGLFLLSPKSYGKKCSFFKKLVTCNN